MTEEMLHKHAKFVCDQIISLEPQDEDDKPLIMLPCMRYLIKLIGIRFGENWLRAKINYKIINRKLCTEAMTTPLVRKRLKRFLNDQWDMTNRLPPKRCDVCEACQLPDCGECNPCKAMEKFEGQRRTVNECLQRNCPNLAVAQAEDSDPENVDESTKMAKKHYDKIDDILPDMLAKGSTKITWIGEYVQADATKVYYERVEIDGCELQNGDYVMVKTSHNNLPALIVRIVYMWKEAISPTMRRFFHGEIFIRASDTVLGETGDPREVYMSDRCCHRVPLSSILRKAHVERKMTPPDWFKLGAQKVNVDESSLKDNGYTYYYSKYYDRFTARFEDLPIELDCPNPLRKHRYCSSCERRSEKDVKNIPKIIAQPVDLSNNITEWASVRWQGYDYKRGQGVFLKPGTFNLYYQTPKLLQTVEERKNPVYYRQNDNNPRGFSLGIGKPFCIGYIVALIAKGKGPLIVPQNIYLKVNLLYRPENTTRRFPQQEDLNVVFWSDEIEEIPFSAVVGPCTLVYVENIPQDGQNSIHEWLERDPRRFYFREAFDSNLERFADVPNHAKSIGGSIEPVADEVKVPPLRTLDMFAGCGGLSEGLHQAGVAECRWAIENNEAAAHAYSLNHTSCTVFVEDCNALLRDAIAGTTHSARGLRLPVPGEVELLCGRPPCHGFSGKNRFNFREIFIFKHSLVASFLSYCDYYRPKYLILENVRNFVTFKKGMVLKLTLRTLLDMGYQCTFGILQAGHYGVPQSSRRLIILGAAPGFKLPSYPEPINTFRNRACPLAVTIDGKRFMSNIRWGPSAPRRTCNIYDAISDLPPIPSGANNINIDYGSIAKTQFQRRVRNIHETENLRDHICKDMGPLAQARMDRIPTAPGSDWRDIPNVSVTLSDGTEAKELVYWYDDKCGIRGVCECAAGRSCNPHQQDNTLIPWCLAHTASRHNNWAGLYGRLLWNGHFSTSVTNPEPMGKQGRVLHPEQPRVISVRECARAQGFPDSYKFSGSILDKYSQVGNAVPPPMGRSIGKEIIFALQPIAKKVT